MFKFLFLLFLIVPIIEIYLLIKVGGLIGAIPTIFLVVFTAVLGAWLLRIQGFSTIRRVQNSINSIAQGEIPAVEMLGGVLLLVSGALLLTPGFFTDTIGFLLLLPAFRRGLVIWFLSRGKIFRSQSNVHSQGVKGGNDPFSDTQGQRHPHRPRTIEGEYRKED
ncbi:MAG: FxsA family protein [Gammaproteobacteria bacterium]|nr:FxsA family protein [Gammaproteobacteria bacterium]